MSRATAGFTLIELLVTVTLLSLLVVVLFGGLRFGATAWEGVQAHGAGSDDLRVVQNLLRREIEQAYPRYDMSDPVHPVVDFRGNPESLTFLAPSPQAVAAGGRSRIALLLGRNGADGQLTMQASPEFAGPDTQAWSAMLLRNVAAVRFSYFADGRWSSRWAETATLPELVRVHVDFQHGDHRVWPDLIVAPQIAADVGCVYDYTTKRCQGRS